MHTETFASVFDALAETLAQSANLKARAELLSALTRRVQAWGLPQEAAAARLGITRPRLNDLLRGKLAKFSLDALVNLVTAAGLTLEIRVSEAGSAISYPAPADDAPAKQSLHETRPPMKRR